jgi:hypothetical protein
MERVNSWLNKLQFVYVLLVWQLIRVTNVYKISFKMFDPNVKLFSVRKHEAMTAYKKSRSVKINALIISLPD